MCAIYFAHDQQDKVKENRTDKTENKIRHLNQHQSMKLIALIITGSILLIIKAYKYKNRSDNKEELFP